MNQKPSSNMYRKMTHFFVVDVNIAILRQVLLSRISYFGAKGISVSENIALQMYRKTAEAVMCGLLPDSPTATSSRTQSSILSFKGLFVNISYTTILNKNILVLQIIWTIKTKKNYKSHIFVK